MKLMWFHLMPYTELPDDFREKHPSVWVDIHSTLFDPRRAHHMYNDFMDELEFAAECGFDAVCVNEHHSNGYGLMPSPNLIASSLARRTTDTAICVMGNSLALYNPPTRVAEEFAMIDCISGGRLIAGFPVGTPMDTCFAYGQNPSMLRERYLEAHDLVMKAWQEKDTFAFNGRFNQQRYVNIWPRPVQKPHPPVWIPGGGSVETWQWCAKMDYVYAYLSYFGYKDGQPVPRRLPAICRRRRNAREGDGALRRAGRVFLRPLPTRGREMGDAAGLHHRGDPARRHPGPNRPRRQPQRPPGGAFHQQHGRHR
jgi:alkanesulfonate monooxygenase SsuD/methylene tetrahydromethanopterin reductase-like flavin-dependent oxidoreductase (luciferase family)